MKVAVLGAGRSGVAAAKLAQSLGHDVCIFDGGTPSNWTHEIKLVCASDGSEAQAYAAELAILSPGIDPETPLVQEFAKHSKELVGEIEFAWRHYRGKIIGITGTNGKTTTTELVEVIMKHAGFACVACGNYGVPMSEVVLQQPQPEVLSLELSSFQLETLKDFKADVAVWLNFAPDHMDRYRSVEEYYRAKLGIFNRTSAASWAVIRQGENLPALPCGKLYFSPEPDATADLSFDAASRKISNAQAEPQLDLAKSRLRGRHNAENLMAAALACRCMGVSFLQVQEAIADYHPPKHRCELVAAIDGVEYLNDSKATNLHALEAALRSQTTPVVLIAGGKDKGLDYSELCPLLAQKVRACVVFGQIRQQLADTFCEAVPISVAESLEQAVSLAKQLAQQGDCVLFSPGTSSFDMFSGYEQRGERFCDIVNNLK